MTGARHHHGSDTPTSARAILHYTDQFFVLKVHFFDEKNRKNQQPQTC